MGLLLLEAGQSWLQPGGGLNKKRICILHWGWYKSFIIYCSWRWARQCMYWQYAEFPWVSVFVRRTAAISQIDPADMAEFRKTTRENTRTSIKKLLLKVKLSNESSCQFVGWSVGLLVCHIFLKRWKVLLPMLLSKHLLYTYFFSCVLFSNSHLGTSYR